MGQKHNITDLHQMQSLPLKAKIAMTNLRIQQWVEEYGEDGVYVSFSGGKDSTVLLDLVRKLYPSIVAVFVDTGLEYPEIREFVKRFENVEWLKPKKTFRQVITEYGYPFISKEVSGKVYEARSKPDGYAATQCFNPNSAMVQKYGRRYDLSKWKFFFEAPFKIGRNCCNVLKKNPIKKYEKDSQKVGITAQMASESAARTKQWLTHGCNGFDKKRPISNPMSFWTEQDVLLYIRIWQDEYDSNLRDCNLEVRCSTDKRRRKMARNYIKKHQRFEICSVYGDIVGGDGDKKPLPENVINMGVLELDRPLLKTTGYDRTGCMFCGYGCHLEKPGNGRFERMKLTHPKQYDYIMRPREQGGLGYKEIIDWINEHGNFDIRY